MPSSSIRHSVLCFVFGCAPWFVGSSTRDWTGPSAVKAQSPNHWTIREFPTLKAFVSSDASLCLWGASSCLGQRPPAGAAAKSLQSCPTLCDPIDSSPPGSPVPGILQARTLEWVAISFSNAGKWKVKGKSLSRVWLLVTSWTVANQAPLSMGFSRQEYWSGVPLPLSPNIHPFSIRFHCWTRLLQAGVCISAGKYTASDCLFLSILRSLTLVALTINVFKLAKWQRSDLIYSSFLWWNLR